MSIGGHTNTSYIIPTNRRFVKSLFGKKQKIVWFVLFHKPHLCNLTVQRQEALVREAAVSAGEEAVVAEKGAAVVAADESEVRTE